MSNRGFVRVFSNETQGPHWINTGLIQELFYFETLKKCMEFLGLPYNDDDEAIICSAFLKMRRYLHIDCTCCTPRSFSCAEGLFPLYGFKRDSKIIMIHPDENEVIQRLIEGTQDPMYDFVQELRYNPNSFMQGRELQEASERFEKIKKIKK